MVLFFKKELLAFANLAAPAAMRAAEIALLLVPVAMLLAWWYGIRGLSRRGMAAVAVVFVAFAAVLYVLGSERSFTGHYHPAVLQNGQVRTP